ncbi:MAG: paraquat-inducible protein B [Gammaproteobacteria bacterium]|nr:MAG: paraquat-inducible protein B [Gammaproteobacteria bacterium]
MSSDNITSTAQAVIKPMNTVSRIWMVPIITAMLGLWMVYYYYSNQGPLITIELNKAEGVEAGVTKIKLRDVQIGKVVKITLKDSLDGVLVSVRMSKEAKKLLVEDAKFWLVSTKINHSGISDLSTLFSGNYIEMQPGKSSQRTDYFKGLDERPISAPDAPGIHITLNSAEEFAFKSGAPILYKGLHVGQIEDVYFNFDERVVYYNAFIEAPYHKLVTENTRFWDISGVQVDLKAQGISLKTGSLETLLSNGITFGVPNGMPVGDPISKRAFFDVFASYDQADAARYQHAIKFALLVEDSVRGLLKGAPVEYRGVIVGRVESSNLMQGRSAKVMNDAVKIPVLISIQPGRIGLPDTEKSLDIIASQMERWLKHGLKAKLSTGNILTGSKIIELFHAGNTEKLAENYKDQQYSGYRVIPVEADEFSQLADKTSQFIANLAELPLDKLSDNANNLFTELAITAQEFQKISHNLEQVLSDANKKSVVSNINETLNSISKVANDFAKGSQNYDELTNTLLLLQDNLQELKPLLRQVNNKPNSLVFSGALSDDIEPKKVTSKSNNANEPKE